ncbi:MAG: signal peptidase II [Eubacteriales bacterium]|nr:signal peptidase II [Eubacteriales bacterium]
MADSGSTTNFFENKIAKALIFVIATALLVMLDQWTKSLAVTFLKGKESFVLIENVLELSYLENTGAAFGMMKGGRTFFLILAPLLSIGLFIYANFFLKPDKKFIPLWICFLFITAGALGNLIDRYLYAYVVDFIYFSLIDFPVFNVADIYVSCSAVLLILLILFKYKEEDF